MKLRSLATWGLVTLGLSQMIAHMIGFSGLKKVGAISVASPLPLVFSEKHGWETFASTFQLRLSEDGQIREIELRPEHFKQLNAPYQYRNAIGAAVSYGPVLPEDVTRSVLHYAFQSPGPVSQALGLEPPLREAQLVVRSKTKGRQDQVWTFDLGGQP